MDEAARSFKVKILGPANLWGESRDKGRRRAEPSYSLWDDNTRMSARRSRGPGACESASCLPEHWPRAANPLPLTVPRASLPLSAHPAHRPDLAQLPAGGGDQLLR